MVVNGEMKLRAAKRELAMRRNVYPDWVRQGRMTKEKAEFEIAVMKAIVEDYEKAEASNAQLPLSD